MSRPPVRHALTRILPGLGAALVVALATAVSIPEARAFTYAGGDVLYVAYQSPSGANYIVDLGPQSMFVNATGTLTFASVTASDLNGVIGASAPDIFVGLFGVLNPSTRDGILSANGPTSDGALTGANILGAVNQTDSFGSGVTQFSSPVPSANPAAASFASGSATGSYQSTLNAVTAGSLGNNLDWTVETQLSDDAGARNAGPVLIPFYKAIRNPFTGSAIRAVIGFFTLNPDGTITYSPTAFSYASGDVLYVAYQAPNGPNYIVNLGSQSQFVGATATLTFPNVLASDLNDVIGASATDIFVGLFGVLNPSTRDGILSANGPTSDGALTGANILGAVNQTDSFGHGVAQFSSPVPSATLSAASFADGSATGSYQSTLDAVTSGSLGNNLDWTVETQLSDDAGARNAGPVSIPFYKAIRNPFTGTSVRAVVGSFTLNPDGTIVYLRDTDGDFTPDVQDCNPTDATAWALPGQVPSMTFASGGVNFSWTVPADPGGTAVLYDVFRTQINSSGAAPSYACLQPDLAGPSSSDAATPPVGRVFLYLVAAGNSCGDGVAGTRSNGQPIAVPSCP